MKKIIGILLITAIAVLVMFNLMSCGSSKSITKQVYDSTGSVKKDSAAESKIDSSGTKVDRSEYKKTTVIEFDTSGNGFEEWLESNTDTAVIGTDYIPFIPPTALPKLNRILKITVTETDKKDVVETAVKKQEAKVNVIGESNASIHKSEIVKTKKSGFNWWLLLWLIPVGIIFYILWLLKQRKNIFKKLI